MRLAEARKLAIGDRVLAHYARKTREGWIVHIDRNEREVFTVFRIAVLGERYLWEVFPRGIVRRVPS